MTDFDGFEDNFGPPADDIDPAAEFLAREHDELSGLEDDGLMVNGASDGLGNYDYFTQEISNNELNGSSIVDPPPTREDLPYQPTPPKVKEVPEKILKWKEEQEKMLAEKDAQEETKKEELRLNAKKELEEWYKHDQEQIEKTRAQNRNAEREYVMERDTAAAADADAQDWERIAKLCDFNPKLSKNTKDVSRMRSIILQLKQTPLVKS
ncbi:hypothetical protein CHUAL_008622 [Chamberlinius hualienensis]